MKLKLKVSTAEGDYTVDTNLFVIVAWERKFRRKASDMANGVGVEDLAFMAYEACKQVSIPVSPSFDEYIKKLTNIEVVEEETVTPTEGEHTPGASA